jgi:DNA uptake protein ComE-like DNA-binding protein
MKKLTALLSAALLAMAGAAFAQKAETPKATPVAPAAAPKAAPAAPAKAAARKTLVDINSASREELVALPGIGEAYADKIIKGRGESGYSGKDDLAKNKIIPANTYNGVKDMIIAKKMKKE